MSEIKCVRCEKQLGNIMGEKGFQPDDGLAFFTCGHYGSTYFDPMDCSYLECAICDPCVKSLEENGMVRRSRRQTEGRE